MNHYFSEKLSTYGFLSQRREGAKVIMEMTNHLSLPFCSNSPLEGWPQAGVVVLNDNHRDRLIRVICVPLPAVLNFSRKGAKAQSL
jgi:hypothetical protein